MNQVMTQAILSRYSLYVHRKSETKKKMKKKKMEKMNTSFQLRFRPRQKKNGTTLEISANKQKEKKRTKKKTGQKKKRKRKKENHHHFFSLVQIKKKKRDAAHHSRTHAKVEYSYDHPAARQLQLYYSIFTRCAQSIFRFSFGGRHSRGLRTLRNTFFRLQCWNNDPILSPTPTSVPKRV